MLDFKMKTNHPDNTGVIDNSSYLSTEICLDKPPLTCVWCKEKIISAEEGYRHITKNDTVGLAGCTTNRPFSVSPDEWKATSTLTTATPLWASTVWTTITHDRATIEVNLVNGQNVLLYCRYNDEEEVEVFVEGPEGRVEVLTIPVEAL